MQDRRVFFKTGVAAALSIGSHRILGANDRVNMGIIGLGGRGTYHVGAYSRLPEANIVALCDVNQAARERASATVVKAGAPKPAEFEDMRKLFEDKTVEAVSMATPNHWHSLGTIWACQAGKDVYCEKPASHNIFEGRKMVEAARKYQRMVQIGSQNRSVPGIIKGVQLLKEGVIGKVYLAKGLCYKRRKSIGRTPPEPVPAGVNWDLFLGPAPMREFTMNRFRYNWHWFWDTGNGDIGNQGIHEMDKACWGLDVGLPTMVSSMGGKYVYEDDQETPNTQIATFDYGDKELMFEVRGIITGGESGADARGGNTVSNLFFGADGYMVLENGGFKVYKGEQRELVMEEKPTRGDAPEHMQNFLAAVKSRKHTDLNADVEVGARSMALVHMANISYRLKRALKFDPATWSFPGDAEANRLATRVYRKPYIVPDKV
ncbi:MAG TPA: Gfo/Idh/MocA family oxidoreductase [Bryobacteraceae bacterium]|nr:Gfo/Idh/MocA family oxidoreductase [Bryobacteraceae bacterium]HPT27896.1 Gfo/Idh/MocA family oxidoreductase [Bryobacteraceae bacterium]